MSVIHWDSTKALAAFRDKPAALSVFWVYASRLNNEGVAWPSLRGLVKDTGWSINTISEARQWLIDHQALTPVDDYIRPEWRNLPASELAKHRNLDHSEYYRSTGYIVIDGVVISMLYHPGHEAAKADVSSGATSDAVQHGRGDTEYTTSVEKKRKTTKRTPKDNAPKDALIDAWCIAVGVDVDKMGATMTDGTRRKIAEKMLRWKIPPTPEEIRKVVALKRRKGVDYEFCYLLDDIPMVRAHNHLQENGGVEGRRGVRLEDSISYYLPPAKAAE